MGLSSYGWKLIPRGEGGGADNGTNVFLFFSGFRGEGLGFTGLHARFRAAASLGKSADP